MGHQSYIAFFKTTKEYEKIINIIKEHNTSTDYDNIGEELDCIVKCNIINPVKCRGYKKCLIFSNGGGRTSTFRYFQMRNINLECYEEEFNDYIENGELWEQIKLE